MRTYTNKEFPKRATDKNGKEEDFSVDVVCLEKDSDMMNIGFYNFDTEKWMFHTETLIDPYEFGEVYDFTWCYNPFTELQERERRVKG